MLERVVADRRYACGNGYAGKAGAIAERLLTDRRYAVRDGDAGKAGAILERLVGDRRYAAGDGYAGKASATVERAVADRRYACGNGYAGKAGTILERVVADRCYACANGYAGKAGATVERAVADRRYACGNGYAGKAGVAKRLVADSRYGVGDGYAGKVAAIGERIVADSSKRASFGKRYAGNGGICGVTTTTSCNKCSAECGIGKRISTVANSRYGQVCARCVGAVIGGYNYRAFCRAVGGGFIVDSVRVIVSAVDADKDKVKPCRAGGVLESGFGAVHCRFIFGVGSVEFARYRFYAVRCYGGGYYRRGCVPVVPIYRVYFDYFFFGCSVTGARSGSFASGCTSCGCCLPLIVMSERGDIARVGIGVRRIAFARYRSAAWF